MTNQTTSAQAGGEAQPIVDANSIDSIVDNAVAESNTATKDTPEAEAAEPNEPVVDAEDPWPKKAENALAKAKGKAAQLRAERDQERAARQRLEQQLAQYSQPQTKQASANNGEPKETDFNNYAEYMRAVQKFDLQQEFAARDSKQQVTQQTAQEQAWVTQREQAVATKAQEFVKENPEVTDLVEEFGDVIDGWQTTHPHITRAFLEADNAPLAFYNLAKEGKLEELANMSPARAAMEIGRAQTQAIAKPKTKAPTPLPAARGSVAVGKKPEDLSGDEIRSWMRAK